MAKDSKATKQPSELLKGLTDLLPRSGNDEAEAVKVRSGKPKELVHNGITWVDVENPSKTTLDKLAEEYGLDPVHIEASLSSQQLPELEKEKDYLFFVLYLPSYSDQKNKLVGPAVKVFLGKKYVITLHEADAHCLREWFKVCEQDDAQREEYIKKSTGVLVHNLISSMLAHTGELVQDVMQEIDDIEDYVFDDTVSVVNPISQMRQKIVKLKRIIKSSRPVLKELTASINDFTNEHLSRRYRANEYMNEKLFEIIDEAQETIEIYKDADFTTSTERTNQILAILTIIFTFAIPATIIGTFYGMNILLPGGLEAGPWEFWGPYTTLILALIAAVIPAAFMYWYFKKKKWF